MNKRNIGSSLVSAIRKITIDTRLWKYLSRHILARKTLIFYLLFIPCLAFLIAGKISPEKATYSDAQLNNEKTFANGSGAINLTSMIYSEDNNIILLKFDTTDSTTNITRGINSDNLSWKLYSGGDADASKTTMDVIPLTDGKVYAVIKNAPKDFSIMVVRVKNKTAVTENMDVSIQDYENNTAASSTLSSSSDEEADEDSDLLDFYITKQNTLFTADYVQNLSRERFALNVFNEEKDYQEKQLNSLTKKAETLQKAIEEYNATIEQLKHEAQYLVGSKLEENQEDIESVQQSEAATQKKLTTAQDNIKELENIIDNLEKNIEKVKDGSYEFSTQIKSVDKAF